ncbi:hypothetical protein B0H13DRAFT_2301045 [Mycena leptocephala]|nr:hypothetical protein B0H13DRAFT_2301045 [Mycena leptocephala]
MLYGGSARMMGFSPAFAAALDAYLASPLPEAIIKAIVESSPEDGVQTEVVAEVITSHPLPTHKFFLEFFFAEEEEEEEEDIKPKCMLQSTAARTIRQKSIEIFSRNEASQMGINGHESENLENILREPLHRLPGRYQPTQKLIAGYLSERQLQPLVAKEGVVEEVLPHICESSGRAAI